MAPTPAAPLRTLALAAALLAAGPALAQTPTVPGLYYGGWYDANAREHDAPPQEFRLINYFFTRATATNLIGDPSGLKGVALGPIGNYAGSLVTTGAGSAMWVEQRWIPVIEYMPNFLDGRAAFRAQFEIDYMWGWTANSQGQNVGGGLNADQVNVQTKNVNFAWYPYKDPDRFTLLAGTQSLYDNVLDPTRTGLNDITRTGYKLAYAGTDATGIQAFRAAATDRERIAWFPLNGAQPDKATKNDPRLSFDWIAMADGAYELAPGTWLGASLWFLNDATKSDAWAYEGLVRAGPASSTLAPYTGTQPFQIERANGNVVWLGVNGHHNVDFRAGRFGASGFFMYNAGKFTSKKTDTLLNKEVSISGFSADAELLWNYGRSANELVSLEAIVSNGDKDPTDKKYTGPFTLNYYGLPGAVFFNHRLLLLMPFTSTVGNYTGAVTDISNQGSGLLAVVASASRDLVPNKLNLKLGAGHGQAWAKPVAYANSTTGRGKTLGTEVNAELKYTYRFLMTFGLHAAYMFRGDWYDGETSRVKQNPYGVFTTLTWYGF